MNNFFKRLLNPKSEHERIFNEGYNKAIDDVTSILKNYSPHAFPSDVITAVATHYSVTEQHLLATNRYNTKPRHVLMYLLKALSGMHESEIATLMRRDRTTVLHGLQTAKNYLDDITEIKLKLTNP